MAKSPRTGENRGRRAADRKRVVEELAAPQPTPSTVDDHGNGGQRPAAPGGLNAATREAIARRAYEIYTARGGTHGYDIEDWLQAERELLGNR